MKKSLIAALVLTGIIFTQSQQLSTVGEIARTAQFSKVIDEINNGKQKIKYSDIQGIPYYTATFEDARVGDTSGKIPIRYNTFLDTIELLEQRNVYELPREESYPKFTFDNGLKLVFVNTFDQYAGYFFELASGKTRLLKKVITKFYDPVPAPNSLIPGTPARFETEKPIYFIRTADNMIRVPKNDKDLIKSFPDKADELKNFIKKNNIKMNQEPDLIKLVNFLNQ